MSLYGLTPSSFYWKERWRVETDYRNRLTQEEKEFLASFNLQFMQGVNTKGVVAKCSFTPSHEGQVLGTPAEARGELAWALRDKKNLHKAIRLLRREK